MKKTFAILGALAAFSMAGAAKAEMKYVDVPSGHWAYDAIEFADKVGCWEGYPDGTFRGNRNITRYEMAMLVQRIIEKCVKVPTPAEVKAAAEEDQKALAEIDKLKAMIKKLEAEFKDELKALQGKVKKLAEEDEKLWKDQKRQDKEISKLKDMIGNVKVSGTVRSRMDSYGSDLNARLAGTALPGDPVVGGAAAAAAVAGTGISTEMGYELFYDVIFKAQVNDLTSVMVEFNNWAQDLNYGTRVGSDRTPVVDQAYAALDLTSKTQSLDALKITAGTQYVSFGPHHLLVDNGWESAPLVRVDVSKDMVDFTGVTGVIDQGAAAYANPVPAGTKQDAYTVARLGLNLKPAKVGINYVASGVLKEKGWGVDIETPLLRKTNWFNGLTGEFFQLEDDRNGRDPGCVRFTAANGGTAAQIAATTGCSAPRGSDNMDMGWTVGLDIYKSKKTLLNAYYADIGLTTGLSGAIANPFNEFNAYANTTFGAAAFGDQMTWGYALNPFLMDSYHMISPDFEGFGAKVVHKFSHDLMVSGIFRSGDYNSAPALQYPTFGAVRVTKGVAKDTTFAIDYSQYGNDDIWLNRVRGELVVSF